jgi:hypothetical protein
LRKVFIRTITATGKSEERQVGGERSISRPAFSNEPWKLTFMGEATFWATL